nr:MAG TPA: hypothetical protein [Caudoviricetes sp.]
MSSYFIFVPFDFGYYQIVQIMIKCNRIKEKQ